MAELTLRTVCVDCADAHAMARFYGGLLGWEPTFVEDDWVLMRDPGGGAGLSFQAEPAYRPPVWPEQPAEQQKMLHLEVRVAVDGAAPSEVDRQAALDAAVARAVAAGGRPADHQARTDLRVVLDPAGHPLCLFLD